MPTPLIVAVVLLWLGVAGTVFDLAVLNALRSLLADRLVSAPEVSQLLRLEQVWSVGWIVVTLPLLLLIRTRRPVVRWLLAVIQITSLLGSIAELVAVVTSDLLAQFASLAAPLELPASAGLHASLSVLFGLTLHVVAIGSLLHRDAAEYFRAPEAIGATTDQGVVYEQ